LRKGSTISGPVVQTETTNSDGEAKFTNIEYGHYTSFINHDDYHQSADSLVTLQTDEETSYLNLNPKDSDFDLSLSMNTEHPVGDYDFKLYA
jgi:hypothetical protein